MATAYLHEYADVAYANSAAVQIGAEPANADQTITTGAAATASAAFNTNTRVVMVSTPADQAVACLFGAAPVATVTNCRLPANSVCFFGVKPGHKVSLIDVD